MGATSSNPRVIYDLCYQPNGGGTISNFSGGNTSVIDINTTTMVPITATATVVPGAGTWKVGFCASTVTGTHTIDRLGYVNGWVQEVD